MLLMAHDISTLRKLLRYDPETGSLFWRERDLSLFPRAQVGRTWNTRYAGKEAMTALETNGYRQGKIMGEYWQAHRAAWAIAHGYVPTFVDHINGIRADNRLANLRDVSCTENNCNARIRSDNKSGVMGVTPDARSGKWRASIKRDGKFQSLGLHDTVEAAAAVRRAAQERLGFHPNHGRV